MFGIKSYRFLCQVFGDFIFFRDEKCSLIMLFAVLSADAALLLLSADRMFAAGYSALIFFFFNWIVKSSQKLQASFQPRADCSH